MLFILITICICFRVVGGLEVLAAIESVEADDKSDKPLVLKDYDYVFKSSLWFDSFRFIFIIFFV